MQTPEESDVILNVLDDIKQSYGGKRLFHEAASLERRANYLANAAIARIYRTSLSWLNQNNREASLANCF
jgi:hypothetical protein